MPMLQDKTAHAGNFWGRNLLVLGFAWALLVWLRWPLGLEFKMFAFYDPGAALKADLLLAKGLVPTQDFAYSYGLLSLDLTHRWFQFLGRTPEAYAGLSLLMGGLLIWGMARLADSWHWRWWQLALCVLALPIAIPAIYLNPTHVIEAVLLTHALALQARGRWASALLLTTLCLFIKPSMAYGYGFILLMVILWNEGRQGRGKGGIKGMSGVFKELLPATIAGLLVAGYLMLCYGVMPLYATLIPLNAGKSYQAANFGFFFGVGREFWIRPRYQYYHTIAGFWLLSTVVLVVGWWVVLLGKHLRPRRGSVQIPARGAWMSLVLLHLFFICFLYAWKDSWVYYSYLLVLGVVTAVGGWGKVEGLGNRAKRGHRPPKRSAFEMAGLLLAAGLAGLAVLGQVGDFNWWRQTWRWPQSAASAHLFAEENMIKDLAGLQEATKDKPTLWLVNGAMVELLPEWTSQHLAGGGTIESWWLSPALPRERELSDIRRKLDAAEVVVRFTELQGILDPWNWDEFALQRAQFDPSLERKVGGRFILEYRRPAPTSQPETMPVEILH